MKWYSVKKYSPPISTYCLVFTENNYTYVARFESKIDPSCWIRDYYCKQCENSDYEKIVGVTHFAIIEPVEIEENHNPEIPLPKLNDPEFLNTALNDFCAGDKFHPENFFSVRTIRALKSEGIENIGQLLCWCDHQLLKVPNLGKKSLLEIKELFGRIGLTLNSRSHYKLPNGDSKCVLCIFNRC